MTPSDPATTGDAAEVTWSAVDGLARYCVAAVAPFRFAEATSDADRETSFRLRYRAVVERGWHRPDEFPDGLERDEHDARAVVLAAWHDGALAATGRMVFPAPGVRLPTEEAFGITVEPVGRVVDAGRFVVAREYSSMEHRALAGLLAFGWLAARSRGYAMLCSAFATRAAMRLYERMGFRTAVLAPPRFFWGETRYPIRWDVVESAGNLGRRWGPVRTDPLDGGTADWEARQS